VRNSGFQQLFKVNSQQLSTMSISKTRNRLVECARELFARQGFEATTMNDIAAASGKGRRTLYTYFKNKEELYEAVITSELEILSERLDETANKIISPEEKIIGIIYTHLSVIKEVVTRNGSLRAEFFRDIRMVERVRRAFDEEERSVLRQVLQEGVDRNHFKIESIPLVADIIHYAIKGMEVPYIYDRVAKGLSSDDSKRIVCDILNKVLK
jgi:AcrR family transcriptional regulator